MNAVSELLSGKCLTNKIIQALKQVFFVLINRAFVFWGAVKAISESCIDLVDDSSSVSESKVDADDDDDQYL